MKYVFERGQYPKLDSQVDMDFDTDDEAIAYAIAHDIDYVWSAPEDRNPESIYRKAE